MQSVLIGSEYPVMDTLLFCTSNTTRPVGYLRHKKHTLKETAFASDPVDTTGAGDGFWGGFLHRMLTLDKRPAALTVADAADCARWGNATAALCITRRGGIPAMPALGDVQALLLR